MLETIQKKWWVFLLRGILLLIFGILAVSTPGMVLATILFYFGFIAILSGIFVIIEDVRSKSKEGAGKLEGLFYIFIGLLFIIMPEFVVTFTLYFIAFWALFAGIFMIISAIKMRKVIQNEWLAILNGIITVVFGILIFANVLAGAEALVIVFGFYAILSGLIMIILSFKVKGLKN
ncbi:MAG: DUF308 domain-containing protein [Ignavibacteria bacterium]|nr:DUF308 domain-containing protein [Ignavibacteria bacterium]